MFRWIPVLALLGFSSPSIAQRRVESIQEVPYDLLQSLAQTSIDFESYSEWTTSPKAINRVIIEGEIRFATRFDGQSGVAQRTGTHVNSPLALTPLTPFSNADIAAAFYEPDGFRTLSNYIRRSPYLPLVIGGVGRRPANMLSGILTLSNGNALTSFSPRLQLRNDGGWDDHSAIGIEPIALMFDSDQTAVGFTLVYLDRRTQIPYVGSTMYDTLVQIKFFRRDGSLISELDFPLYQTARFAFARCGETVDIAGLQITNSSRTGFAVDDIIFGMPGDEALSQAQTGPLTQPDQDPNQNNPLQVDLCSYYTS